MKRVLSGILVVLLFLSNRLFAETSTIESSPTENATVGSLSGGKAMITGGETQDKEGEHPLIPVLHWAYRGRPNIEKLKDYTAVFTKQESINGELQDAQMMDIKVRHEPFSVYIKFRWPRAVAGQEAIYIRGQNDEDILAHGTGLKKRLGTLKLSPEGMIAMQGNKYPITDVGLLNLVDKLVDVGERDVQYGECNVEYYEGVKMDERDCTLIRVTHPVPRKTFKFYIAQIIVDNEYNIPLRYESYTWPSEVEIAAGQAPPLIEAYTYQKLRLNVGLTDKDFDVNNPAYDYPK
ncbi:MAG: DUF1571 domain-containing protein [Thermoguttaceae bacterium]